MSTSRFVAISRRSLRRLARVTLIALAGIGLPAGSRVVSAEDPAPAGYTAAELRGLVGPVALYPDTVIASLLPATTYPDDVTAAAKLLKEKGGSVTAVPDGVTWDASVQALLQYPDVLTWLTQNGEWAAQMGYAVSVQQSEVMVAIQAFRKEAQAAGNLASDAHHTVSTEDAPDGDSEVIVIEPTDPAVVYVPTYPPAAVVQPGYAWSWGVGFAMGVAGAWAYNNIHWGHHGGEINYSHNTNINVDRTNVAVGPNRPTQWKAPAAGKRPAGAVAKPTQGSWGKGTGTRPGNVTPPRAGAGAKPGGAAARPPSAKPPIAKPPASRPPSARPTPAPRPPSATTGAGSGSAARAASDRGGASLRQSGGGAGGGGSFRGQSGRGGGGGRRR